MGKKIDRAALHVLAALTLYLVFAAAFRNIWAAAACALCAMLCLRRVLSGLTGRLPQREKRRERARAEVERWALLDAATAEKEARALLEKAYPGQLEGAEMAVALRHPQGPPLDASVLLDIWRGRADGRLIIVSTARADAAAHACAGKLAHPAVCLIDAARLGTLLEKFPPPREKSAPSRRRLHISVSRERAPRRLLFGLLLLLMYLLLGNPLYLGASLLTLFLAALGWKKPPVPRRLFPGS